MEWLILLFFLLVPTPRRRKPDEPDVPDVPEDGREVPEEKEEQPYVPKPGISPLWPLPRSARKWDRPDFGSGRPWLSPNPTRKHGAIDIKAREGDPVLAPDAGLVIATQGWDGPKTRGLLLQTHGGPMLVLGAIAPGSYPPKGTTVQRGEKIAEIGRYPGGQQMLHFEVWKVGTTKRAKWMWEGAQPASLVNPHKYLLATVDT